MDCLKSCWQWVTKCLHCSKEKSEIGPLFTHENDFGGMGHLYTVRRISSFGRDVLGKDDDTEDVLYDANETNKSHSNNLTVPWTTKTLTIQTGIPEQDEDGTPQIINNKKHASPNTKQKGRWAKALGKVKKRENFNKIKSNSSFGLKTIEHGTSNQLSEITLDDCKTSYNLPYKENTLITGSTPDLLKHRSPSIYKKCLAVSSLELRNTDDTSDISNEDNEWLKSLSMQDVNSQSEGNLFTEETEREQIAKAHGLDLSLYTNVTPAKSNETLNQEWKSQDTKKNNNGIFQEQPSGIVFFTTLFDAVTKRLEIFVEKLKLCGIGKEGKPYKAVVKLTILPGDKHHKTSNVLSKSLEPIVDTRFKFSITDCNNKTLRISVYEEEWQSMPYDAVGHTFFNLEDVESGLVKSHQMKLFQQSKPDMIPSTLHVTLAYQDDKRILSVIVDEARNLRIKHGKGKYKTFIKIENHSGGKVVKEKQSPMIVSEVNTKYNYSVNLKIDQTGEKHSYIIIKLKEHHLLQDRTAGKLILGPYFYYLSDQNVTPWGRAILQKEIVSECYRLWL